MTTKNANISIHWHMQEPSLAAQSWRTWSPEEFSPHLTSPLSGLEVSPLCQEILKTALNEKLSRSTGFECAEGSSQDFCRAVEQAAAVFKRGVAFRLHKYAPITRQIRSGSYPITLVDRLDLLSVDKPAEDIFYIFDQNVYQHWCSDKTYKHSLVLLLDERSKTLDTVHQILHTWKEEHSLRRWVIVGGGVVADTAMFAASLVQAEVILCPTTLLAMVDACVGGKTGVNVPGFGKNLIGSFYFPAQVWVCPKFLGTLPKREWNAGLSECMKHAFITHDLELLRDLTTTSQNRDISFLKTLLPKLISIKARIVEHDPNETGERAILNFGHTLAHALEAHVQNQLNCANVLLHGEAVAFGMLFSILLSHHLSVLTKQQADAYMHSLTEAGLNLSKAFLQQALSSSSLEQEMFSSLLTFIKQDKKMSFSQEKTQWVLLRPRRETTDQWTTAVSEETLRQVWSKFIGSLPI